jgi:putative phosphoesterase
VTSEGGLILADIGAWLILAPLLRERLAPLGEVRACLGLISDTHMPDRLAALPAAIFEALAGVDLLLHAGDVGELSVLDELSRIAPVVAVHGNDDTAEAQRELPYRQVLAVAERRVLLCHSHDPDRARETASRLGDDLMPKLERWAGFAAGARADVFVFGHVHIPFAYHHADVLVVNPGAIASPNGTSRQRVRTVALMYLMADGRIDVAHVDLAEPGRRYEPAFDPAAGFKANAERFGGSMLSEELEAIWPRVRDLLRIDEPARQCYWRLAHRCWAGEIDLITPEVLRAAAPSLAHHLVGGHLILHPWTNTRNPSQSELREPAAGRARDGDRQQPKPLVD